MVSAEEIWHCEECDCNYMNEEDAIECCKVMNDNPNVEYVCGKCDTIHNTYDKAEECCKEQDIEETTSGNITWKEAGLALIKLDAYGYEGNFEINKDGICVFNLAMSRNVEEAKEFLKM